ncbi:MAG: hypothetical protein V2A76_11385, partial [Planctomycetota bacterium]
MTQDSTDNLPGAIIRRPWFGLLLSLLLLFWIFLREKQVDPDLFGRVAVGRLIEARGGVPEQDPFAYTRTKPVWIDHEWLSGVVFYRVARFGGDSALFLFKLAVCALSILLLAGARMTLSGGRSVALPSL